MSFVKGKFITRDKIQVRKGDFMEFQKRLKDIREDHDLKQSDVAAFLKIDRSYYGKYERDEHPLPIEHLRELCRFYNISADYFLGLIDKPRMLYKK